MHPVKYLPNFVQQSGRGLPPYLGHNPQGFYYLLKPLSSSLFFPPS